MSAMIRRRRPAYIPAWGDLKHRQASGSASLCEFSEDLTDQVLNEIRHRQQRTGSPGRPGQSWLDADLKVWHRLARARGNHELVARLEVAIKARQHARRPIDRDHR